MRFRGAVVGAGAIGNSDRGHQRDAGFSRTERAQNVAHATVVDALSPNFSGAVRAECEYDGPDTFDRGGKRTGARDVT